MTESDDAAAARAGAARARMERTRVPGVYRRGAKFVVVWRHRGRQHKQSYATFQEALAARARHRAGDTRPTGHGRLGFKTYARDWVDLTPGSSERGLAESTRRDYRRSIEAYLIPALGHLQISDIEPRDIRRLIKDLEGRGHRPSTVRKNIAPLRAMLATAVVDGDLRHNPATAVRIATFRSDFPAGPELPKALTRDEVRALLDAIDPAWRLLVEFLVHTGLRISEALALTWDDVELATPVPRCSLRSGRTSSRSRSGWGTTTA